MTASEGGAILRILGKGQIDVAKYNFACNELTVQGYEAVKEEIAAAREAARRTARLNAVMMNTPAQRINIEPSLDLLEIEAQARKGIGWSVGLPMPWVVKKWNIYLHQVVDASALQKTVESTIKVSSCAVAIGFEVQSRLSLPK